VEIALWRPLDGSLELAEGLITAGESYVISTQPKRSSLRGGPSLSGSSDRRFAAASAPEGKMYVISQPLSRFPSVTSSMIGGVNQAKCAPPILPSQDRAVDHHDFTKKAEVKLPDSF
jgi:hypothetical protein